MLTEIDQQSNSSSKGGLVVASGSGENVFVCPGSNSNGSVMCDAASYNLNHLQPHRYAPYPLHQPHLGATDHHHHHNINQTYYYHQRKLPTTREFFGQDPEKIHRCSRSSSTHHSSDLPPYHQINNALFPIPSGGGAGASSSPAIMHDQRPSAARLCHKGGRHSNSLSQSARLASSSPLEQLSSLLASNRTLTSGGRRTDISDVHYGQTELEEAVEEEEAVGTHISQLFPEILTEIFSKLTVRDRGRAAQVCSAWRDAAYSKSVWKGCEATLHLRRATPHIFNSLIRRGIRKLQVLSLRRTLKDVVFGLPQLESLNLSGCYNVTDLNLGHAFSAELPNLKFLDLSLCKQITDGSLSRIAQHLKNLEVLELGGCSNITNTGLLLIAWGLKKLRHLNLRSCWHISDTGIGHLAGLSKETAEGNLVLEYLGLQDCQRLSDEALKHISEGLVSLRAINLSFCVSITDSGLKYLARMSRLEELNLRACDNVSDIGMNYLAADSHSMMGGGGGGGGAPTLTTTIRSLDVSFCDKIGDQALMHISQGLLNLRSLSLSASSITDEGLDRISKSLHELQTLNIGQCSRVTDAGLKTLAENSLNLRAIDLYGCTKITAQGLEKVMTLPKLATLNLGLWHVR